MLNTLLKDASLSGKLATQLTTKALHPTSFSVYEHYAVCLSGCLPAVSLSGHLPTAPSPRLTIQFLTMMMKLGYIRGTIPNLIKLTQHKVQYTITTLMGNLHLGY